jgi:hypothetical protein
VPHAVTITGSRRTEHRERAEYGLLFDAYLRPFAGEDSHIYVGGAVGIDTLALDWLAEHTPAALTVVVPCTLADQPEQARQTVLRATRHASECRWSSSAPRSWARRPTTVATGGWWIAAILSSDSHTATICGAGPGTPFTMEPIKADRG